jgi:hypothetical protein
MASIGQAIASEGERKKGIDVEEDRTSIDWINAEREDQWRVALKDGGDARKQGHDRGLHDGEGANAGSRRDRGGGERVLQMAVRQTDRFYTPFSIHLGTG